MASITCVKYIAQFSCKCNQLGVKRMHILSKLKNFSKLRPVDNKVLLFKKPLLANYYVKKKEKNQGPSAKFWFTLGGVVCGICISAVAILGKAEDGQKDLYKNVNPIMAHIYRLRDRLHEYKESFAAPSSEVLLPDPLPEPYIQPKYTLVLELTDILVHPEYDRKSGWRFRKRPGVKQFLSSLTMPLFEIVIYTHENGFSSAPVCEGLDPDGYIMYKLFRDATSYINGTHVKDLSKLNRDITKVILIDCDPNASSLQPRNSLILKKWEGDPKDTTLLELIPLLHTIAMSNVDDVRPVLDFYRNEDDVVAAFRRNQEILLKQQEEFNNAHKQQKKISGSGLIGSFFGRR
ncbi:mitochondrial import inner membrane translocase subunit TIM50 isoform X1 [Hydra vulgaris]|uniref:mitochondrial import inner membrane translocase subunit TIM50 isoform X1 n=1 Tax=Hydra vulgaris TaxID=6087 RepID=UPI001F5F5247|nr:mitochondrial import inner membrane translocase subunit TIM50 [Hydra vulgaris]